MPCNKFGFQANTCIDRNADDTANDDTLAQHMIDAVKDAKAWAARGASKLDNSVSILPIGKETKDLVTPLLGDRDYNTAAKDVRGNSFFYQ